MIENIADVLGKGIEEPDVTRFLATLGPREDVGEDQEDSHYANFTSAGVSLLHEEQRIITVFLFRAGHQGKGGFRGALPLGVQFDMTQPKVRALLGPPPFQMPAKDLPFLGRKGPVDRYDAPRLSVALDYDEATGRVCLVTLMVPDAVPGGA